MTDNMQQMKDDISFLKDLASDDGSVLEASGIGLMVAGCVFFLFGLRNYLVATGLIDWPDILEALATFEFIIVFFTTLFVCFRFAAGKRHFAPPRPNATSKAMWASWAATGFGYLAVALGLEQAGAGDVAFITLYAFFGGGWLVVWAIYKNSWMLAIAFLSYVVTILIGRYIGTDTGKLIVMGSSLLLLALPGLLIFRQARAIR